MGIDYWRGAVVFEFLLAMLLSDPIPRRPEPTNVSDWIKSDDYPAEAYERREAGVVRATLTISDKGLVENCEIRESSGSSSLDAAACALVSARARFRPAIGKNGEFVTSHYPLRVNWEFPWPVRLARTSWSEIVDLTIARDTTALSCQSVKQGPFPDLLSICSLISDQPISMLNDAVRDIEGHSRRLRVENELSFEIERFELKDSDRQYLIRGDARLAIAEDGKIIDCETAPGGNEGSRLELCEIAKNIEFSPEISGGSRQNAILIQSVQIN